MLKIKKYSNDEVLVLLIDSKLTKTVYLNKNSGKKEFSNLYPIYNLV